MARRLARRGWWAPCDPPAIRALTGPTVAPVPSAEQPYGDLVSTVLRAVTHLDVSDEDIDRAIELIPRALGVLARA